MNQELIDQIRKIVEKVLQEQIAHEKQLLAVFGATRFELDAPLHQLRICEQNGWKITIILSELATKVIDVEPISAAFGKDNILEENDLKDIPIFVEAYQQIVLPVFSYPMVAKLALKLVDTPCSYLVFEALSKGKKVIAASDALNQGETSIKIGSIEGVYADILSELGVELVPVTQIAESVKEKTEGSTVTSENSLISVATLAALDANVNELVYTNPALITPLAREHAKKRGIKLTRKR